MKKLRLPRLSRRGKLIRNLSLTVLMLLWLWFAAGMPSLGREQAFQRALREDLLPPCRMLTVIGGSRENVVGAIDGALVNGVVTRVWGPFWTCSSGISVTPLTDGTAIVPLQGSAYQVAVLAEGGSPELTVTVEGKTLALVWAGGDPGGLRLFRTDFSGEEDYFWENFFSDLKWLDRPGRTMSYSGYFTFRSYDTEGKPLTELRRDFGPEVLP